MTTQLREDSIFNNEYSYSRYAYVGRNGLTRGASMRARRVEKLQGEYVSSKVSFSRWVVEAEIESIFIMSRHKTRPHSDVAGEIIQIRRGKGTGCPNAAGSETVSAHAWLLFRLKFCWVNNKKPSPLLSSCLFLSIVHLEWGER